MENRILVQTTLGKNWDSTWITTIVKKKIIKIKKAGGVAQAVRCLPTKCKALSSNPSTIAKKKRKYSEEIRSKYVHWNWNKVIVSGNPSAVYILIF
jgi:hypothetical protein